MMLEDFDTFTGKDSVESLEPRLLLNDLGEGQNIHM